MKKILITSIVIIALMIVSLIVNNSFQKQNEEGFYELLLDENGKALLNIESSYDMETNIADSKILDEISSNIAIIKIDTIDGGSNINSKTGESVSPYSYGKATILKVIKGEINSKSIIYARAGATLTFDEWIKGEDNPEKLLNLMNASAKSKGVSTKDVAVRFTNEGDIDLEIGKIYLAYMTTVDNFNENIDYFIIEYQFGLRELENQNEKLDLNNFQNIKVKNNDSGNWEKMNDTVYILKNK